MTEEPLITWKDWQNAIADAPHLGHALLQNVEIDSYPGAVRVGKKPITAFHTALSDTFTADSSTDTITLATGTAPNTGTAVTVSNSGGALPNPLAAGTNYFAIKTGSNTFKLATTIANANASTAIDLTTNGSGTNTVVTVNPGTIRHYAVETRGGTTFCIDSNGRVWYYNSSVYLLLNGNTLTNGVGNGLAVFRNSDNSATYLFAFRNASIDVVNVFGSSQRENPTWTNGWQSMNSGAGSGNSHYARVGQDNIVYFCDDRYIGSIAEKAGSVFDPANAATYTYNNQALDLPLGKLTYWLEELGTNLMITVSNDGYIYPWDRTSDSYGLPLPIGEYGGNKMQNIGNIVYVLAGTRGNIYWTQGTYVRPYKTIPYYLLNNGSTTPIPNPITWGGIGGMNGKLIVGVGANNGNSGVYMIDPNGKTTIDNYPSTGAQNVTAIYAVNDFYQMGYASGADTMDTNRYSSLGAVVLQSQMYRIGDHTDKVKISQIEYQIANAVTGGQIRASYRTDLSSAFTTLTTFSTTGLTSDNYDAGLTDLENIQFQLELTGAIDLLEFRAYK